MERTPPQSFYNITVVERESSSTILGGGRGTNVAERTRWPNGQSLARVPADRRQIREPVFNLGYGKGIKFISGCGNYAIVKRLGSRRRGKLVIFRRDEDPRRT